MKKGGALALLLAVCLSAAGCGDTGADFDIGRLQAAYTQAEGIEAEAAITTHSGVLADYVISFTRSGGISTATLIEPESLAGISARTFAGRAEIEYEEVAVETLLPPVSGFVPADALAGVIDDLAGGVPVDYCAGEAEGDIALTYETDGGEYAGCKRIWLDGGTLAVTRAEFYLDGQMVMSMTVRNLTFLPPDSGKNTQAG